MGDSPLLPSWQLYFLILQFRSKHKGFLENHTPLDFSGTGPEFKLLFSFIP